MRSVNPVALGNPKCDKIEALQRVHGIDVVPVGQNSSGFFGNQLNEFAEGFLNVRQVLKIVQVIRLHIQHHRQSGEEV